MAKHMENHKESNEITDLKHRPSPLPECPAADPAY
jgi:hypothetical protein